jgi:hypothetical protein
LFPKTCTSANFSDFGLTVSLTDLLSCAKVENEVTKASEYKNNLMIFLI